MALRLTNITIAKKKYYSLWEYNIVLFRCSSLKDRLFWRNTDKSHRSRPLLIQFLCLVRWKTVEPSSWFQHKGAIITGPDSRTRVTKSDFRQENSIFYIKPYFWWFLIKPHWSRHWYCIKTLFKLRVLPVAKETALIKIRFRQSHVVEPDSQTSPALLKKQTGREKLQGNKDNKIRKPFIFMKIHITCFGCFLIALIYF